MSSIYPSYYDFVNWSYPQIITMSKNSNKRNNNKVKALSQAKKEDKKDHELFKDMKKSMDRFFDNPKWFK